MRTVTRSRVSAALLACALAVASGCAVDTDDGDLGADEAPLAVEDAPAAAVAIDLDLKVWREYLGCDFQVASYFLTAHANGHPTYRWFVRNWDGSWLPVSQSPSYLFKAAVGHRRYLKVEACTEAGCDTKQLSIAPVCIDAP